MVPSTTTILGSVQAERDIHTPNDNAVLTSILTRHITNHGSPLADCSGPLNTVFHPNAGLRRSLVLTRPVPHPTLAAAATPPHVHRAQPERPH